MVINENSLPAEPNKQARDKWITMLEQLAKPIFSALEQGKLIATIPALTRASTDLRNRVAATESFCRLTTGLSAWINVPVQTLTPAEKQRRQSAADQLTNALTIISDPTHPDSLNFVEGNCAQFLVEAAFLALGLHRSRQTIWDTLTVMVKSRLVKLLKSSRIYKPGPNNWLLFSATVEAFLATTGEADWDAMRVDYAIRQHEQWYKGDGVYGDGTWLHCDYYNSFVIQPFLLEILDMTGSHYKDWADLQERITERARRYAAVQERLIMPDGSFPALGRSLCYRFGVFQLLALIAKKQILPEETAPAQIRCALTAVLERSLGASGTFDQEGWLRPGLFGYQPGLAENYISTGSLYLAANGFLPLELPPDNPFWSNPDQPWTAVRLAAGEDLPADHALADKLYY